VKEHDGSKKMVMEIKKFKHPDIRKKDGDIAEFRVT